MASHRAANQGYVYGTAARNMAAERERTRKQRVVQYRQDMSHTVRKNQEKALQMNLPVRDHADTGSSLRTVYLYRVSACAVLHDRKDPQH